MIIPTWHHQLAVQTREWTRDSGSVPMWTPLDIKWRWGLLAIPPLIIWICGSGYLTYHVWKTHPLDSSRKKMFWTIILVIPVIGWLLYGSFYGESKQESWIKL